MPILITTSLEFISRWRGSRWMVSWLVGAAIVVLAWGGLGWGTALAWVADWRESLASQLGE